MLNRSGSYQAASPPDVLSTPPPGEMLKPTKQCRIEAAGGKTIFDFPVLNCYHELYDLSQHKGQIVLICNVASKCKEYGEEGFATLSTLHRRYCGEGLQVLAFPCNQFGNGEPGNEEDIADSVFCTYPGIGEISFPIMAKVEVNGDHELPLFGFLKSCIKGTLGQSAIRWNFTYFLVDRDGIPLARFPPGTKLEELEPAVQQALRGDYCAAETVTVSEDASHKQSRSNTIEVADGIVAAAVLPGVAAQPPTATGTSRLASASGEDDSTAAPSRSLDDSGLHRDDSEGPLSRDPPSSPDAAMRPTVPGVPPIGGAAASAGEGIIPGVGLLTPVYATNSASGPSAEGDALSSGSLNATMETMEGQNL